MIRKSDLKHCTILNVRLSDQVSLPPGDYVSLLTDLNNFQSEPRFFFLIECIFLFYAFKTFVELLLCQMPFLLSFMIYHNNISLPYSKIYMSTLDSSHISSVLQITSKISKYRTSNNPLFRVTLISWLMTVTQSRQ